MSRAAEEIQKLREQIINHNRKYYQEADPEISDREYDRLYHRLQDLEEQHPELVTDDSPTQRVGGEPVEELENHEHRIPMLSIDNTYDLKELKQFGRRTEKSLSGEKIEWVVELKIDGVAASVLYENGRLVRGLTRGNGRVGDDITHNVRTIHDLPLKLQSKDPPPVLEIRGEIYMTNQDLVRLNEQQKERGESTFANTRNVTAGTIRTLDPKVCAKRRLRFFGHGVGYAENLKAQDHLSFLDELESYGIPPTPNVEKFEDFDAAVEHCQLLTESLHELDFEIDGLVLKVNRFDQREKLGATSKSPRWLIAYKFEKYEGTTRLEDISVQVGKSGIVTPVAKLKPVQLAGTTVSRASLHNADEIERKDVRIGDQVVVEKAGKIIPHIVRVDKHQRKGNPPKFDFPDHCPSCETKLEQDEGGVYIRCPNLQCPAQVKERIQYFAGRNAMDIDGLGEKLIEQLVDSGKVRSYGDLYRLKKEDVKEMERMGEKSSHKLIDAIDRSRGRGLARLVNALSIRYVGNRVAQILADHFGSLENLGKAEVEEITAIDEIGPIIARSVYDFFHGEQGRRIVEDLKSEDLLTQKETGDEPAIPREVKSVLEGKKVVVTGTLPSMSREAAHALIEQLGGRAVSSVSSKTDYLLAGEDPGSKLDKAKEHDIPIISEDDLKSMLQKEIDDTEGLRRAAEKTAPELFE